MAGVVGPMRRLKLAQAVGVAGGVALMVAPAILAYAARPAGDLHRVVGPLVVSVALIALSGVTVGVRWVNLPLGAALVVAPAIVAHTAGAAVTGVVIGLALMAATPFGGRLGKRFDGGWWALRGHRQAPVGKAQRKR